MRIFVLLVVWISTAGVYGQLSSNTLKCRLCQRASRLSDCNSLVLCDSTLEECYMDELITDQRTVVYTGGCRGKDICQRNNLGKRSDLVSCTRCCSSGTDCNKRLCGIPDDTLNRTECYSCGLQSSVQASVRQPENCISLTTCNSHEMCYTSTHWDAGVDTHVFGCANERLCKPLMQVAYEEWKRCVKHTHGTNVDCGGISTRSFTICSSCCNYGGCNTETCYEQRDRLFELAWNGKLDINTLQYI
ncbi:hypothetical protein ACF0H5_004348 [Mactra antiquata]